MYEQPAQEILDAYLKSIKNVSVILSFKDEIKDESLDISKFVYSVFKNNKKDFDNVFLLYEKD